MSYVAYYRVSTKRQGTSGLGLEAQREAVEKFVAEQGGRLVAEFKEVESGTNPARPQLAEAIKEARRRRGTLIVGKLDRLGRKAWHLLKMLDDPTVPIRFADFPDADETMLGIMAVFAQREAKLISQRVTASLSRAKARGSKLGSDRPGHWTPETITKRDAGLVKGRKAAQDSLQRNAAEFAEDLREIAEDMQARKMTLVQMADHLNAEGYPARRGGRWNPAQVSRLLQRLNLSPPKQP